MNYPVIVYGSIMSIIDVIVFTILSMMKKNLISENFLPMLLVLYGLQPLIFYYGLSYTNMSVLNLSWNLMSNIIVTTIGVMYIGNILSLTQCIGIIVGIVALYLLNM